MAAQTVHFFTGSSKTLSKALLTDLFKGVAHISLMPFDACKQATGTQEGGIKWADLSFNGADEIFTIKDSFTISQADATSTEIKIDQKDSVIDTTTEKGEWTFAGNIPAIEDALAKVFYNAGATVANTNPMIGNEGTNYTAHAYFAEPKEVYAVMMVENKALDKAIAFARVKITLGLAKDDATNPAYFKMAGTILTNPEASGLEGDWAICDKYVAG